LKYVYDGAIKAKSGETKAIELQKDFLSKLYNTSQINDAEFMQLAEKYGF